MCRMMAGIYVKPLAEGVWWYLSVAVLRALVPARFFELPFRTLAHIQHLLTKNYEIEVIALMTPIGAKR